MAYDTFTDALDAAEKGQVPHIDEFQVIQAGRTHTAAAISLSNGYLKKGVDLVLMNIKKILISYVEPNKCITGITDTITV